MTGIEVLRTMREMEKSRPSRVPCVIIVLTAAILTNEREQTARLGADYFEPKPITRTRLLEHLQKIADDRTPPGSPRVMRPSASIDMHQLVSVLQQQSATMALTTSTPLRPAVLDQVRCARGLRLLGGAVCCVSMRYLLCVSRCSCVICTVCFGFLRTMYGQCGPVGEGFVGRLMDGGCVADNASSHVGGRVGGAHCRGGL